LANAVAMVRGNSVGSTASPEKFQATNLKGFSPTRLYNRGDNPSRIMCILTENFTHKNSDTIIAPFIGSEYPCQYAVRLTFTAATALALALALALL
jgi:hypothetical protein